MALRLREASLVSDMSAVKRRLIELETQVCAASLRFSLELGNLHRKLIQMKSIRFLRARIRGFFSLHLYNEQ